MKKYVIAVLVLCLMEPSALFGVNTKIVPVPRPRAAGFNNENLDIDQEEAFTTSTFSELIQEKAALGLPYIIARVTTRLGRNTFIHYFDAHSLNTLYGAYPFTDVIRPITQQNPLNRQPIKKIQYFTINNINEPSFEYLGSDADVSGSEEIRRVEIILYANQDSDLELAVAARNALGNMYYSGYGVAQDYGRAREYYEQIVARPNDNPLVTAEARNSLGSMYYLGRGVAQDYGRAREYYEQIVASPNDNPLATAEARNVLGSMYYLGRDVAQDYGRAREYYEQIVASPNDNPLATAEARNSLGSMYYLGRGVDQDYARAREYYEQIVASPNDHAAVTAHARYALANMYYLGHGVAQDYGRAREYYEQIVANPNDNPQVTAEARNALASIYYLGNGVAQDYARAREYYEQIVASPNDDTAGITARAYYLLGIMYHLGQGVGKDYKMAREYYEQVIPQDNPSVAEKVRQKLAELEQEEAAVGQVLGKRQQEQGGPSDVKRRRGMGDDDQE